MNKVQHCFYCERVWVESSEGSILPVEFEKGHKTAGEVAYTLIVHSENAIEELHFCSLTCLGRMSLNQSERKERTEKVVM